MRAVGLTEDLPRREVCLEFGHKSVGLGNIGCPGRALDHGEENVFTTTVAASPCLQAAQGTLGASRKTMNEQISSEPSRAKFSNEFS